MTKASTRVDDIEGMGAMIKEYFQSVFAGSCDMISNVSSVNNRVVSNDQNMDLIAI